MIDRHRLQFCFDPASLREDLERVQPEEWIPHFNTQYYDGDWSGVVLRGPGGKTNTVFTNPRSTEEPTDTAILARCPWFQRVLASFHCPLKSARLLRLSAGAIVREHRDYGLGYEAGEVRIHVPIVTNPRVEFFLNNRRVVLAEGEVWYLDLGRPHRVRNLGETARIHLVVDMMVNDWLRAQIPFEDAAEAELEIHDLPLVTPAEAAANLGRFRELVRERPELQEQLRNIMDRELFLDETVRLGRRGDCQFTASEVESAMLEERRKWIERWIR